jgi:hypothetical protein
MKAEIDQSGKLEHLNTHSVIAVANNSTKKAVYISSSEKIKLVKILRKSIVVRKDLIHVIFASMIFLLVKDYKDLTILIIDEEYTGKEKVIDETLSKLYLKLKNIRKPIFMFAQIGKSSPAHAAALKVYKKKTKIDVIHIKSIDILNLWKL